MGKPSQPLTAAECRAIAPGKTLYDREGLALIGKAAGAYWRLRFTSPETNKRRDAGLGAYPATTLSEARERAAEFRAIVRAGIDPLEDRRRVTDKAKTATVALTQRSKRAAATLETAAREFHRHHRAGLRNAKHAAQWISSLETSVFPTLGNRPLAEITADDLLAVLAPLADQVPETARRVRQRIDVIYADAILNDLADKNPAQMIKAKLRRTAGKAKHFRALPYADVPAFVVALRAFDRSHPAIRLAIEFLILTAARSGEVRGMRWSEVDGTTWAIPAGRMKRDAEHRVPLTKRALTILQEARPHSTGKPDALVFPGRAAGAGMSDMTLLQLVRRMPTGGDRDDGAPEMWADRTTLHGFRSAFKTWAMTCTKFRVDVIEAAMAHKEADRVAAAYSRTTYEVERAKLAADWARFVEQAPATVHQLPKARAMK